MICSALPWPGSRNPRIRLWGVKKKVICEQGNVIREVFCPFRLSRDVSFGSHFLGTYSRGHRLMTGTFYLTHAVFSCFKNVISTSVSEFK